MKNLLKSAALLAMMGITIVSCDKDEDASQHTDPGDSPVIFSASGDSSAIIGKLNEFRQKAGSTLNITLGAKGGRREINWDGVPAELLSPGLFPGDFFNPRDAATPEARKRGLAYFPTQATLLVSDQNFAEMDTAFRSQFKAFSKTKLFSAKGTNVSEVRFFVPGTLNPAYVSSFGLIFSDVDHSDATGIELYEGDKLLGRLKAQPSDKKYSFLAAGSKSLKITRVRITAGNTTLAAGVKDGAATDIVVMDDFIYSEPVAYP